jgi:hypothetical protein
MHKDEKGHPFFESFKASHLLTSKESPQRFLLYIKIEHSFKKQKKGTNQSLNCNKVYIK